MNKLEKDVLKFVALIIFALLCCRVSDGWFAWLLAFVGCFACMTGSVKIAITCFILLPTFNYFSPVLVSGSQLGLAARVGQIAIVLSMLLSPTVRHRRESIPLGWLFAYAVVAFVSSIDGWMPIISYLKILNFVLFVVNIILLGKMIQVSDDALYQLRVILLGFSAFIVIGSVVAYFIPSVGYSMEVLRAESWGVYTSGEEVAAREGQKLFSGVLNHSQALANNIPLWFALVLCDMLFIERRVSRLHMAVIISAPIIMYMSRSRTALVVLIVSSVMIAFYAVPFSKMATDIKRRIRGIVYLIILLLVVSGIVGETRNQTISKWIRKQDDISLDDRSLGEAFTSSRMGLVEYNLRDFHMNPWLGKGFQVMEWHAAAYTAGRISLLSAPIEKGVLPLMIIGETGIVGGIVFICFLVYFYMICFKRKYRILLCLFTGILASNMSEASFFSPGGAALQWTVAVIGGFGLDLIVKKRDINAHLFATIETEY